MGGDKREQMWVSKEFAKMVKDMARQEQEELRLRKKPSSVDITHKLVRKLGEKRKPLRFNMLR